MVIGMTTVGKVKEKEEYGFKRKKEERGDF
jgi:hypothetical protein